MDQIAPVRGEPRGIGGDGYAAACHFQRQLVSQADALHDHFHLVIAVLQPTYHIQAQIDFGVRHCLIFSHLYLSMGIPVNPVIIAIVQNYIQSLPFRQGLSAFLTVCGRQTFAFSGCGFSGDMVQ
jgi:hypothetical protein